MRIDADFAGGSIVVDAIDGDTVRLHQELRDTGSDWFYWYFRIRDAAERTVFFDFTASQAIGTCGPAISTDGGQTWSWLGRHVVVDNSFVYTFDAAAPDDVRFSFAMPHQQSRWLDPLATGVGLPYASAGGAEVDQATARRFGADLGAVLALWLLERPTPTRCAPTGAAR